MVAAPLTGGISMGVSMAVAAPLAATAGVSASTIIFASAIGIGFLLALYKDYDLEVDILRRRIIMRKR